MLASGLVRPLTTPLVAPFSGMRCVAYRYRMYFVARRITSTAKKELVAVYWGYASRPFALDGPARRVPVFAVPRLDIPASQQSGEDAVARARVFIQATTFERTTAGALGAAFEQFRETLTDEDGELRHDWRRDGPDIDPSELILEEAVLPIDVGASVHGPWSSARGGIVAPGALLSSKAHVVAILGSPKVKLDLDKLEVAPSTTSSLIATVIVGLLGAGLIWFATILPGLR